MARIRQRGTARLAVRVLAMHATVQNFDGERWLKSWPERVYLTKPLPTLWTIGIYLKGGLGGKLRPPFTQRHLPYTHSSFALRSFRRVISNLNGLLRRPKQHQLLPRLLWYVWGVSVLEPDVSHRRGGSRGSTHLQQRLGSGCPARPHAHGRLAGQSQS
jgi:hypothetical protein